MDTLITHEGRPMPSSRWLTQMNPMVFVWSFVSRCSFEHHFLSDLLLVYYGF